LEKKGNSVTYHPLSANQTNIWNLESLFLGTPINVITTEIRLNHRVRYSLIQEAINIVLEKDVSLRTRIHLEEGVPKQYAVPYEKEIFPFLDFSMTDEEGITHWAETMSKDPMPLYDEPLYRFVVYRIDANSAGILVRMHHIISDGWTQLMLCNRIGQTYLELVAGKQPTLEEAPPYLNHLEAEKEYFNSDEYEDDKEFWQNQLEMAGPPTSIKTFKGNNLSPVGRRKTYQLSQTLNHAIFSFCMENRIAPFSVFYIALATYMARITGEKTLTVGVPVFNRVNFAFKQTSGMFVSTLPLVFTVDEDLSFDESFKQFGEHWLGSLRHQRFPFGEMLKLQNRSEELFHLVLSYQDGTMLQSGESSVHFSGNWHYSGYQKEHLCIHMTNLEDNKKYAISYDYLTQLFTDQEIEEVHNHLCHILRAALDNPMRTTNTLLPLNDELKETVLYAFNRTSKPLHTNRLFDLFTAIETRHPNRVALIENGQRISYSALRFRAGGIASLLETQGQLIAIILPKSIPLYTAMIGIVQAGCSWVLISPDLPAARISEIIDDSGADKIITNGSKICFALEFGVPVINIEEPGEYTSAVANPAKDDLAYVVYTSGSTGKPKGVEVTCRNLMNLVQAMKPYYSKDAVLSICSIEFDAFMLESIVPMLLGRTIVIPEKNQLENPKAIANLILGYAVGFMAVTPSRLGAYLADKDFQKAVARLEKIICGGESISEDLISRLESHTNANIYNQYGPSETCVAVSISQVNGTSRITAGKPMDNCRLYVLDKWMQPLPVGVYGDLYIGGICVGKGYRNNRELTAQKFVSNPFETNDTLYLTGDIACWSQEGEIVLAGRTDKQVKIRGLRIELEDISSCLASYAGILDTAAKVFEVNQQPIVLAYYTSNEEFKESDLIRYMGEQLPYYMLPTRILHLEEMPLTHNGKIDDSKLPLPEESISGREADNDIQRTLLEIFSEVLENNQLTIDSDYFLSGGNSLNAMETIGMIEDRLGVRIKISDLYACRTVALVADQLGGVSGVARTRKPSMPKAPVQDRYPLSSIQRGIYVQSHQDPTGLAYNMPGAFEIEGTIDMARLNAAFRALVATDEIFQMNFEFQDGTLWQIPREYAALKVEELEADTFSAAADLFLRPFDLNDGPLIRVGVFVPDGDQTILFFDMHHIISDGLSTPTIFKRLSALYSGKKYNVRYTYKDYLWQMKDHSLEAKDSSYWRSEFENMPHPLDLPADHPRPELFGFRGAVINHTLSKDLSNQISEFCASKQLTEYMFFVGAYAVMLSKFSGQKDLVIGSPVSNRTTPDLADVCGPFLETLPLRIKPTGEIKDYMNHLRNKVLGLLDHSKITLEEIIEGTGMPRTLSGNPLFRVLFSLRPMDASAFTFGGNKINYKNIPTGTCKLDLSLEVAAFESTYQLFFEYSTELFEEETIQLYIRSFEAVVREMTTSGSTMVEDISGISPKDRVKYIERPAKRVAPYLEMPLNQVIEEQSTLFPDEVAVICGEQQLTFGMFLKRAREIAGLLQENGVMPGDKVGIVLKRNKDLLPALVGTLMAGAAYVPFLDTVPEKRILYMMENADAKLILCDEHTCHSIETLHLRSVDIKTPAEPIKQAYPNKMTDTIYVLYTSGSTGMPKGVQLPHRAISNLLECIKEIMVLNTGRVLCTTNITFDIFITESLLALAQGFCVVLADEEAMVLPYKLADLIEQHDVRVMQFTPSRLHINMQNKRFVQALAHIERVIVVGENMPASTVNAFKAATTGQLFNMYGPTEAAVYVTQGELFANEAVTIGRPLNNCRLYIVDSNMRVLPPTARGEICIAGICLADGYIGCEDLTEKMFINDAVINGERMYRSGDIGCQRLDGSFECFGRVDSQIKVNGMRLEPQEIVDAMTKVGVEHAAVYPLKNKDGTITLYGFASPESLSRDQIKNDLKKEIPAYMIPTEIYLLPSIPHNDSGKTDMKKLEYLIHNPGSQLEMTLNPIGEQENPVQESASLSEESLEAPSFDSIKSAYPGHSPQSGEGADGLQIEQSSGAPTAEELLGIWEKTLGKTNLHKELTYFEQGGTSLGALGILGEYYNMGFSLTMADFYSHPSAVEQAQLLEERYGKKETAFTVSEVKGNSQKEPKHRYVPSVKKRTMKDTGIAFLTGGGGYLGAHILFELLNHGTHEVICLVRVGREEHLFQTLREFFGDEWLDINQTKITVKTGDVGKKDLGMHKTDYNDSMQKVEMIYHCAADVRHYADEQESVAVNVDGTQNIIEFAKKANAALHHISTTSVAADYIEHQPELGAQFFEMDFDIGQNWMDNVYVKTKFLAEEAIYCAIEQGLDAHVYRVGRLVGRAQDGKFQENPESNAFYMLIRAIRLSQAVPESMLDEKLELTPVDECAAAIVSLADSTLTTLHLASPHLVGIEEIIKNDPGIKIVSNHEYDALLRTIAKNHIGHEITPLLDYVYGRQGEKKKIDVSSIITQNELVARRTAWSKPDTKILLLSFFNKTN
jgi:amino acid adenylation domain-containing protein/thioester reductase-like protein